MNRQGVREASPLKLLVVVPSLGRGGAERTVSWLARAWSREHRVTVAVFNGGPRAYAAGGDVLDLGLPPVRGALAKSWRVMERAARLRRWMRAEKPDRIIAFMENANLPVLLAALSCGMRDRVTLSIRSNPDRLDAGHGWIADWIYGAASRVVLNSREGAARMARRMRLGSSKVRAIYNPLPLEGNANVDGAEGIDALAAEPFPESGPYFLALGRLVPGKDFVRMLRLFAAADVGPTRLLIAGEGPERARLEGLIREAGLDARVRLLGALENPFPALRGARALLMTSRHEGFPMSLLEAFACGCPVVAADCDFGPREALADGACGFLVPLDDDAAFIAALERLVRDPELRDRLGRAARSRALDFDARRIAPLWLGLADAEAGGRA